MAQYVFEKELGGPLQSIVKSIEDASGFYAQDKILTLAVVLKLGHQNRMENLLKTSY